MSSLVGEEPAELSAQLVGASTPSLERAAERLGETPTLDEVPDREDDLRTERVRLALDHPEHDVLEDRDLRRPPARLEAIQQVELHEEDLPRERPGIVVTLDLLAHPVDVDRERHQVHVGHTVLSGERRIHDRRQPERLGAGLWQAPSGHVPELATIQITAVKGGVRFELRVSPRANRDAIGGVHGGALRVKVKAPPVDGKANAAIVKQLAKALRVPKRAVRIISGESSKTKRVEVDGVDAAQVQALA